MFTPPNVSRVTCHVSRVTCHMSRVTCHMLNKLVKLIGGGSVINGAYPVQFLNKQKNKQKTNLRFFSIFYNNFFSRFSRPIFVRKIRLKSLNPTYRYLRTANSHVIKTTKKRLKKKLTIETWSQKLGTMAGFGPRICRKILTDCCFWYFLAIFFSK